MKNTSIPVFSGQGSRSIFSAKSQAVAVKDSSSPTGSILLDAVHHAFGEELSSLTAEERSKSGVNLSDFPTPKSLLEPREKYQANAIVQGTTLCLFQLLRYLSYVENTPDLTFENLPSRFLEVSGFCSGSLPAAVVVSSHTVLNFLSNSVEAFKLALWIGYRCELFRVEESVSEEKELLSWGLVVFGWTREAAVDRVTAFNAKKPCVPLHLTAVTAEKVVTISGRGDLLAQFQIEEVAGSCSSRFTSVHTLYHGGETLQNVKSQLMVDLLRRHIKFPSLSQAIIPMRSTVDGNLLSSTNSDKSLLEIVVDQVLISCVNWDKTVGSMITAATQRVEQSEGEQVTVVNFGPGTGSVFQVQKPPHPRISLLDLSHTSDAANTFANKKPLRFKPEDGIAIVGMGVNMPGATDPNELWKILEEGLNTVSEIPSNRFDVSQFYDPSGSSNKPKRSMGTKFGNFIENPSAFDNNFFNISPREAKSLDPQQRVLLQTAYSAIENAGYVADSTDTFSRETFGCYVGVATGDYVENLRNEIDVYYSTGTLRAFLSGRISYALKLAGPSIVIDTACSSSLVAIYQACRALENGDCNAAVAGGVNVITSPDMYLGLDRAHFLSPTGQCKAFDESADGYCRSEGCGMFVLKRLSDAIAENDQILGVIRGVQVNQSGEAHSITHPHAATQQRLFKRLLEETGIDPLDVSVIEAHGTGTQAGDPIELESLRGTFARNRTSDKPLHITSIKANIGHLEAASGSAGLAKLLLMLRNTTIPKQVSLKNLNPKIAPLGEDGVQIARSNLPWIPHTEGAQRLAVLNNFGAAGSNGILLLEEAPVRPAVKLPLSRKSYLFTVTAKTKNALEALRGKYLNYLRGKSDSLSLEDVCYTATARRQPFNHRIAVTANSFDDLISQLEKATPRQVTPGKNGAPKTVFVFSGQGSQYPGMGRGLIESSPLFRELVEHAHDTLVSLGFVGVLQVMSAAEGKDINLSDKQKVEAFQCSIFVLEYALAKLWTSMGVRPDAVLGHSLGEYAALAISEVLSFEDALKIVANRARMMADNCELGASGMLAVNAPPEKVAEILKIHPDIPNLTVACLNSTADCVVAGPIQEIDVFRAYLKDNAIAKNVKLEVPFGYHSAAMDPIREPLTALAATLKINPPKIVTGSNVLGRSIGPQDIDPEYFAKHSRQPVRFAEEIQDIVSLPGFSGTVRYIEIGPHPISLPMLRSTLGSTGGTFIPSMHKTKDPWVSISESLATLFLAGFPAKWREVFAGTSGKTIDFPSYPFVDNKYWVEYEEATLAPIKAKTAPTNAVISTGYSMISTCLQRPSEGIPGVFETPISNLASFISGHNVGGSSLCPASVYHELAMASARFGVPENASCLHTLGKVRYSHPLVYESGSDKILRVTLSVDSLTGNSAFEVSSYSGDSSTGRVHCSGEIKQTPKGSIEQKFHRKALKLERNKVTIFYSNGREGPETIHTRMLYEVIFPRVVSYSKPYQTVRTITIDQTGTEGFAVVKMPAGYKRGKYVVHPVFMDTLLHTAGFIANSGVTADDACICNEVGQAKILYDDIDYDDTFGVYCNLVYLPKETTYVADAYAMNSAGKIVGSIKGMHFKKLKLAKFRSLLAAATGKKLQITPAPAALSPTQRPPTPVSTPVSREPSPPPMDIAGQVANVVASTCGVGIDSITPSTEMESLGVDSLMIFEIADKLKSIFSSLNMESSELAACHTVQDLGDAIRNNLPAISRPVSKPTVNTVHTGAQFPDPDVMTPPPEQPGLDIKGFLEAILGVNVSDMQPHTELESLGLDSLTSIEVLHSLKESVGLNISPDTFSECRTVQELEVLICSKTACPSRMPASAPTADTPEPEPVANENNQLAKMLQMTSLPVSLQRRDGANSSLFLIHDGSGLCSYYGRLSSLNRSVWGFYNPRFFNQEQWPGGLVEMATEYASYVQQTTPEPYILGGWSYGGVVAFEAGRQLLQAGKKVTGVVLIDSPCPTNHQGLPSAVITAISKSAQSGPASRQKIEQLIKAQFEANTHNLVNYNPQPSDKNPKLILLRSREGFSTRGLNCLPHTWLEDRSDSSAATAGWEELVGSRVHVIDIPGNHFEPFNNKNVHAVSASLDEACRILEG